MTKIEIDLLAFRAGFKRDLPKMLAKNYKD